MKEDMKQYILDNFDQAMKENQIKVYYQPIVRVLTREVCGWEALTRWIKPDGTMIYPDQFVKVLEEEKLIHKLDIFMINKVCEQNRGRMDYMGFMEPVSLNLSRLDFELCDIFQEVESAVNKYRLPRNMFDIEITESALMTDEKILGPAIKKFRGKGYQVWLDDFGSGYSSFNVMKDYDFDVLKIDMEFLRNFDSSTKVKKIMSTIIEMSKSLSIQTVAEGVETEEQLDFLRLIGCEKAQGYYFGKPLPHERASENILSKNLGIEKTSLRDYMDAISGVNYATEYQGVVGDNDSLSAITGAPLAIIQYKDGLVRTMIANRNYMKALFPLGIRSVTEADDLFNAGRWREKKQALQIAAQARVDGMDHRLDFLNNGMLFSMKIRHVATNAEEHVSAYTIELLNHTSFVAQDHESLDKSLHFLCNMFERIDMISLDGDMIQNIYMNSSRYRGIVDGNDAMGSILDYARNNIYPSDRKRFQEFYDVHTFETRFIDVNGRYLRDYFRTIDLNGEYHWQSYTLIPTELNGKNMFISCVSDASMELYDLLDGFYTDENAEKNVAGVKEDGSKPPYKDIHKMMKQDKNVASDLNTAHILENVLDLTGAGIFWKDRQRRFLGANQKFLEYYGFDGIESILGKTDEEVGWHIDPSQFVNDEERVITNGEIIEKSPGQCIIQGEVREIEATKRPLFKDGKIAGLIGYFVDVTDQKQNWKNMDDRLPQSDVDKLSSEAAFHATLSKYEDQYWVRGLDFALVYVELKEMNIYRLSYGEAFFLKLLKKVVGVLRKVIGENSVLIHKSENEFLVLHQYRQRMEIDELQSRIRDGLRSIHKIDNIPVNLEVLSGVGFYSETEDPTRMLKMVDSRKNGGIHPGFS